MQISIFRNDNDRNVIRINGELHNLARYLYEYYYNVTLDVTDIIHHIDGNRLNDYIFNLKRMSKDEHKILHNGVI